MSEPNDDAKHVSELLQGQIFEIPSLPILGSRARSMHPDLQQAATIRPGGSKSLVVPVRVATGKVMLVTQSCDLQERRTARGQVLAHVAPVVRLEDDTLREARRDGRPNFVPVPWVDDVSFADLDQMAVVDRGVLAEATPGARPAEPARRDLAYRLGRYFSRAALPDEVQKALRPMQKIADARHDATVRVRDAVVQIRVASTPEYDDPGPWALRVLLVVDDDWYPDTEPTPFRQTGKNLQDVTGPLVEHHDRAEVGEAGIVVTLWGRFAEHVRARLIDGLEMRSDGMVSDVTVAIVTALTPAEFDGSDVLDFGHLSLDE